MTEKHVLNLGAGVQSTTLYLMAIAGEMHAIDCAIFADTGEEPGAVYKHLEWLQSLGGPPILVRSAGRLGDDLQHGRNSTGQRFTAIPCFTQAQGSDEVGRTRRQCSKEYKTEVIERSIRRDVLGLAPRKHVPKGVRFFQYFGISWDERSRASRIWERFHIESSTWAEPVFPLVERQWTRANCIEYLAGKVPHETPRSACVFCPFHRDSEWSRIKESDPEAWARAVEIDVALRTTGAVANRDMRQTMYLHRSCKPLVQVEFRPRENVNELQLGIGFGVECEGVCGV
ncbi:MAG: hypothetical protein PHQ12_14680 [Chthoniobacteraceae bacterium]|nr:hypothetical protein [Chthoniobacteraceae bacterium]